MVDRVVGPAWGSAVVAVGGAARASSVRDGGQPHMRGLEALRRAIKDVFGEHALVHRCHRHYPDLRVIRTLVEQGPQIARLAA